MRADLIELIETVIIYKLSRLSQEEVQAMLQVHDIRETRVYQEAKAEGVEEGIQQGIQQGVQLERQRLISKLVAGNVPADASPNCWTWTTTWCAST